MAAIFSSGTAGLYQTSYAAVTGNDCTLFASVRHTTLALNNPYVVAHDFGNDGSIALMSASSGSSNLDAYIDPNGATVSVTARITSVLATNRYTHGCAVFNSSTSRVAYARQAGVGRATEVSETTSKNFSTATGISIGQKGPTPGTPTLNVNNSCEIANVMGFSKALTPAEVYRLLNGEWPPDVVQSRYFTMWYPLINDKRCRITGIELTQNGTITFANRQIDNFATKSRQTVGWTPSAVGASTTPIDLTGVGSVIDGSTATLTATDAGATEGTVQLAGVSQTIVSWADTEIQFTVDRGDAKYGGVTIIATTAGATSSDSIVGASLTPAAGGDYTDLADPLASEGLRITALPDLVAGDQLHYYGVDGGGIVTIGEAGVLVNSDGSFSADSWVTGFYVEANDVAWGTPAYQTVGSGETSAPSNLSLSLSL